MRVELINRLEKLEARHGRHNGVPCVTLIHIVDVNPDGTKTLGGTIKVPPISSSKPTEPGGPNIGGM